MFNNLQSIVSTTSQVSSLRWFAQEPRASKVAGMCEGRGRTKTMLERLTHHSKNSHVRGSLLQFCHEGGRPLDVRIVRLSWQHMTPFDMWLPLPPSITREDGTALTGQSGLVKANAPVCSGLLSSDADDRGRLLIMGISEAIP